MTYTRRSVFQSCGKHVKSHEIAVASISAKCSLTSSAAVHVDLIPELVHDVQWPFNEPLH